LIKKFGGTKMKRIGIAALMMVLVLMSTAVCAEQGGQGAGDGGMPQPELISAEGGEADNDTASQGKMAKAQTASEVKEMIQERKQEMDQEMQGMGEEKQNVFRNQNQVREAVHALLAMEGLVGGIGKQVSEVARNFNNSVQATIRAEEKVQERGAFARFFAGGDHDAADEIEQEVSQNRQRIEQLKQLRLQIADPEVQAMYQEQIQLMEKEQARLQELAQKEKQSKGLLGWIWK
jgi:hypothetical protein